MNDLIGLVMFVGLIWLGLYVEGAWNLLAVIGALWVSVTATKGDRW